jgi:hypothetical protein
MTHKKPFEWIPEQIFEVGDIVTWSQNSQYGPSFRLITEVHMHTPEFDPDEHTTEPAPRRVYTWEYLDRGINHGEQWRDDDDYDSLNSSDPQLTLWRRVLHGARRS